MKTLLALLMMTTAAFADDTWPPARFDIGGETVAEVMDNYALIFGDQLPLHVVHARQAQEACNEIQIRRYGTPYPSAGAGEITLGCMIRSPDGSHPVVVITDDWPGVSEVQLLRHECGHILGWPGDHPR